MPIHPSTIINDGGPRLTVSNPKTLAAASTDVFTITGSPIVVWDMWQEVIQAVPGAALDWKLSLTPSTSQGAIEEMQPQYNSSFTAFPVGTRWFFRNTPADGVGEDTLLLFSGAEPICRILVPGTISLITTAPTAAPPTFTWSIMWSPLGSDSNVVVV